MEQNEVIVEVGAEGGSLTLFGVRTKQGWLFSRNVIDQSLMLLDDEEAEIRHDSESVDSFTAALGLLDKYPWQHLCPMEVHPEFRGLILEAVTARYKAENETNARRLPDWVELCSVVGGQPTYCSSKDCAGNASDAYLYDDE